jgi:hypothetical protein
LKNDATGRTWLTDEHAGFHRRPYHCFCFRKFLGDSFCAGADLRRHRPSAPAAARILSWLLLLPIGLGGLWAGFFHLAYPDVAAKFIGWKDSPFQFEVGMADLAFGVAGCIAFRASYGFKAATVLVNAIFLLGDAIGHVHQMMVAGNFAPGNAGPVFYLDIILPVTTIILLLMSRGAR